MAEAVADGQFPAQGGGDSLPAQGATSSAVAGAGGAGGLAQGGGGESAAAAIAGSLATPQPWRKAPLLRQLGVVVALAAAVAIGVAVALWSQAPNHVPLFSDLSVEDQGQISTLLQAEGSEFSIDPASGNILVPAEIRDRLRMKMAQQGLPTAKAVGLEMLQQSQDLSTSQFVEGARYQHALETELARSVSSLRQVRAARVHLALPKQSIFIRQRQQPSASVVVALHAGHSLERRQVEAIVHMVASSIPHLQPGQVSVVDQMGRLLTADMGDEMALSGKQFDYTRRLERDYSERIVRLLEPVVGFGRVRAQVTADIDFDRTEQSSESYDPARQVVRSEQVSENESRSGEQAMGIPGALSNQPPGAGTTNPDGGAQNPDDQSPTQQSRSATRNFEVDKIVSHTKKSAGSIRRLAVAVIVDDKPVRSPAAAPAGGADAAADAASEAAAQDAADGGQAESGETATDGAADEAAGDGASDVAGGAASASGREPYSDEELEELTTLVRGAIGFDAQRGDSVQVINASFQQLEIDDPPELPIWEKPWFQTLVKQVLAGIFILLLLLLIVRPIVRGLIPPAPEKADSASGEGGTAGDASGQAGGQRNGQGNGQAKGQAAGEGGEALEGQIAEGEVQWGADGRPVDPMADAARMEFDKKLEYARLLVDEDSARASNVLKIWLKEEAGAA